LGEKKSKFVQKNIMASLLDENLQHYFTQLNEAEKKSVLLMLKTFLAGRTDVANSISIEQYNKEIDEVLAQSEAGNYITQEEMEKQAAKW
jgi:predicted transcriptional regulator